MAKAEASVEELVGMIERGELRLPEMQRRYVWRSTRVRDLMDSLYRGYPSGAILLWQTDEDVPLQDMAVGQKIISQESYGICHRSVSLPDSEQTESRKDAAELERIECGNGIRSEFHEE